MSMFDKEKLCDVDEVEVEQETSIKLFCFWLNTLSTGGDFEALSANSLNTLRLIYRD